MGRFFCVPSPQAIDFSDWAMCDTADNFVFNFDEITKKINLFRLVDKLVSRQKAYS